VRVIAIAIAIAIADHHRHDHRHRDRPSPSTITTTIDTKKGGCVIGKPRAWIDIVAGLRAVVSLVGCDRVGSSGRSSIRVRRSGLNSNGCQYSHLDRSPTFRVLPASSGQPRHE
jgi:hypothetical protein